MKRYKRTRRQIMPKIEKYPAHEMLSATVRNVEVTTVAVIRFKKVAMLIAFARIVVEKTSAGISHAPGPIPNEKKDRYNAKATIPRSVPSSMTNVIAIIKQATDIPVDGVQASFTVKNRYVQEAHNI